MNSKIKYGIATAAVWILFLVCLFTLAGRVRNITYINDATDAVGFVIFGVVTTIVMFASGYHVRKKYLTELDFYLAEHPEISPNKLQSAFRTYFFLKRTRLFALLFATAIPWYILSPNNKDAFEMRDYLTLASFAILALVCVGLHFYGKKRYAQ